MTTPMHKHRSRSSEVSLKMRLAASKNVRTRHKEGMPVTVSRAPWERGNGSAQERNGDGAVIRGDKATTRREK